MPRKHISAYTPSACPFLGDSNIITRVRSIPNSGGRGTGSSADARFSRILSANTEFTANGFGRNCGWWAPFTSAVASRNRTLPRETLRKTFRFGRRQPPRCFVFFFFVTNSSLFSYFELFRNILSPVPVTNVRDVR